MSLARLWFAARVGAWLCLLPIVVRSRTLPLLLEQLAAARKRPRNPQSLELNRAVPIVVRICRLRFFRLPVFPRPCLRRALALFYFLPRMGYPVEIHFGVRKEGNVLHGHSWITLDGKPLGERTPTDVFQPIYSYPAVESVYTSREMREFQPT